MAISVPVPKEITDYREKIVFGMGGRQLAFAAIAGVLSIGIGGLCTVLGVPMTVTGYIIILVASPFMALGFIRKNNMPFEKYLFLVFRNKMGQNLLTYQTELLIDTVSLLETAPTERNLRHGLFQKANHEKSFREYSEYRTGSKKDGKRKRKIARRTVKAARQEYRTTKRRSTAEAAGRVCP